MNIFLILEKTANVVRNVAKISINKTTYVVMTSSLAMVSLVYLMLTPLALAQDKVGYSNPADGDALKPAVAASDARVTSKTAIPPPSQMQPFEAALENKTLAPPDKIPEGLRPDQAVPQRETYLLIDRSKVYFEPKTHEATVVTEQGERWNYREVYVVKNDTSKSVPEGFVKIGDSDRNAALYGKPTNEVEVIFLENGSVFFYDPRTKTGAILDSDRVFQYSDVEIKSAVEPSKLPAERSVISRFKGIDEILVDGRIRLADRAIIGKPEGEIQF